MKTEPKSEPTEGTEFSGVRDGRNGPFKLFFQANDSKTSKGPKPKRKMTSVKTEPKPEPKEKTESGRIRDEGNGLFKQYKASYTVDYKRKNLHSALDVYQKALTSAERKAYDDKAYAHKNIAMVYGALYDLEKGHHTKMYYIREAARHRADAIVYGESADLEFDWLDASIDAMKKNIDDYLKESTNLIETTLEDILSVVDRDIEDVDYANIIATFRLDQAERYLTKGQECIGEKNFKKALPMLHEMYRPIQEGKKWSRDHNLDGEFRVLDDEYRSYLAIALGLQAYENGIQCLEKAIASKDTDARFELGLTAVDHLKSADVLARGEDAEIICMVMAKMGVVYLKVFKSKFKANSCFLEAMNLSTTLMGNLYNRSWYIEATNLMQAIRDEEARIESEKWENKRKPVLEEMKAELDEIWEKRDLPAQELVDYLFEKYPPKHIKNAKKPEFKDNERKCLLKLCQLYHPDRVHKDDNEIKHVVMCEEITKVITSRYENVKGGINGY